MLVQVHNPFNNDNFPLRRTTGNYSNSREVYSSISVYILPLNLRLIVADDIIASILTALVGIYILLDI